MQAVFGWQAVSWSFALPVVIGWHFIFLVNSGAHLWGRQPYDSGDVQAAFLLVIWFQNNHDASSDLQDNAAAGEAAQSGGCRACANLSMLAKLGVTHMHY